MSVPSHSKGSRGVLLSSDQYINTFIFHLVAFIHLGPAESSVGNSEGLIIAVLWDPQTFDERNTLKINRKMKTRGRVVLCPAVDREPQKKSHSSVAPSSVGGDGDNAHTSSFMSRTFLVKAEISRRLPRTRCRSCF